MAPTSASWHAAPAVLPSDAAPSTVGRMADALWYPREKPFGIYGGNHIVSKEEAIWYSWREQFGIYGGNYLVFIGGRLVRYP